MDIKSIRKWCREFEFGRTEIHDEKLSGRPSTCKETVAKVEESMRKDRRVSLDNLCASISEVSRTIIYRILGDKLQYRKVSARWVPRMLTEDHKRQRVDSAREFLRRCADEKDNFFYSIVTNNETWTYHITPEMEQQSRQWQHSSLPKALLSSNPKTGLN